MRSPGWQRHLCSPFLTSEENPQVGVSHEVKPHLWLNNGASILLGKLWVSICKPSLWEMKFPSALKTEAFHPSSIHAHARRLKNSVQEVQGRIRKCRSGEEQELSRTWSFLAWPWLHPLTNQRWGCQDLKCIEFVISLCLLHWKSTSQADCVRKK